MIKYFWISWFSLLNISTFVSSDEDSIVVQQNLFNLWSARKFHNTVTVLNFYNFKQIVSYGSSPNSVFNFFSLITTSLFLICLYALHTLEAREDGLNWANWLTALKNIEIKHRFWGGVSCRTKPIKILFLIFWKCQSPSWRTRC